MIIPDISGSGQSSPGNWNGAIAIDEYAASVKAMLDAEQITSCSMIGHSMGGYITLAFAEKYPQFLQSFGLFHSSAFADNEEKKQTRLKAIDFITTKGAYTFIKTSTPNLFAPAFTSTHPEQIEALIEKGKDFSKVSLIQYYQAMISRPDRTAVLRTFPRPVLFIMGEHDKAVPLQTGLEQCYLPQQAHIHVLKDSAHMGMWEESNKANHILLSFLTPAVV
ncbi:MAG: alpha/beta hydrolase [Sphingobacteriales bacterium]|nr:alpha/beta hydrolase [Sphingobacteriales bacterium]